MNVLHIYKSYYPFTQGGIERHIYSLSESLYESGISSTILTTQKKPEISKANIGNATVHYFPANMEIASCPISLPLLKRFRRFAQDFDILHYHFPWPFADLTQLVATSKPIVVTYHSDIVRQQHLKFFYHPLMCRFLNQAHAIIATSDHYRHSSPILKKYSAKTTVIPYGLNAAHYPPPTADEVAYWRNRVGENFFLFVGVLRYYKGLHFLLEAVRGTSIRLVIVGAGPEEARLKKLQAEYRMDNVIFTGALNENAKSALHQLCLATVSSAHLRAEAFCISLLESLIFGKPVISTELHTGTSFVNQDGISGLVVPPADSLALRQAMQVLLNDEIMYKKLQQGTQLHYQQYFTANIMRDRHLQLYQRMLNFRST